MLVLPHVCRYVSVWVRESFGHLIFDPIFFDLTVWRAPLICICHHADQSSAPTALLSCILPIALTLKMGRVRAAHFVGVQGFGHTSQKLLIEPEANHCVFDVLQAVFVAHRVEEFSKLRILRVTVVMPGNYPRPASIHHVKGVLCV